MNRLKKIMLSIAAFYVLFFSGCSLYEEGVFDSVVQIDAPWKACEGTSIPLVVNVTHGDKYPVYLESLALWKIDISTSVMHKEFMNTTPPDYVALFRRDWGEHLLSRPLKEDTYTVNTPFQELELSSLGNPTNKGIRIFKFISIDDKNKKEEKKREYQNIFKAGFVRQGIRFLKADELNIGPVRKITDIFSDILEAGCNVIDTVCFGHLFGRQWSDLAVADVLSAVNIYKIGRPNNLKDYQADDNDVMKSSISYSDFKKAVKWVAENYNILKDGDGIQLEDFPWKGDGKQPRYFLAVASYRTKSSFERIQVGVLFLPAFMSVWYHSIDYICNGNPYKKKFYIPFSKDFKDALREYYNTQHSPQYIKKVLRIEMDEKDNNSPILANCKTNLSTSDQSGLWLAGDPHVHTRYTHNPAETGNGIMSTGLAARSIGLDWVTITDHGSNTLDWDLDQDHFQEQKHEINSFNRSTTGTLLIQAQELTVAPQYDPERNTYHLLCYQMDEPDFLSGEIKPAPPFIGIKEISQALGKRATQGSAMRSFVEVLNELPSKNSGFAFLAHPRECMESGGFLKSCVQWSYQDFLTAISSPSVRGLQIWNLDISGYQNISTLWKAHTLDLGRINHLGFFNIVIFSQMFLFNMIMSPFNYGMRQFGLSNTPTFWMFYPKFDVTIDPRKGIETKYLQWYHPIVGETFISGTPWLIFEIYDWFASFSYRSWAIGFVCLGGVLPNTVGWMDKKKSENFIEKIEDDFDYCWRILLSLVNPVTQFSSKPLEQSELPFLDTKGSDRFWKRHISRNWIIKNNSVKKEEEERIKYFKLYDPKQNIFENIERIVKPAYIWDFPKVSSDEIDYRHDKEWKWVKNSVATQSWVQLRSGIDLWDYGIMVRMRRTLDNLNKKVISLEKLECNTAEISNLNRDSLYQDSSMLRLVASAGSDAHGAFNYQVSTMTRFDINIMNYALGKVRTIVRIPESCNNDKTTKKEMILASLANGSSILTNGPECRFELSDDKTTFPVGSVVVIDHNNVDDWKLILKRKKNDIHNGEESIFVGRLSKDKEQKFESVYVDAYDKVFKEIYRNNTGFFDDLSLNHYAYKYGYEDIELFEKIKKLPLYIQKSAFLLRSRVLNNKSAIPTQIRYLWQLGKDGSKDKETLEIPLGKILYYEWDKGASMDIAYIRYEMETFNTQTGETHNCFTNPIWIIIKDK